MNSLPSSLPSQTVPFEQVFLRRVGLWMATGLGLTTLVAGWLMSQPALMALFFQPAAHGKTGVSILGWVALLAPLLLILGVGVLARNASFPVVAGAFLAIAACFGITLAPIGMLYTTQSLITVLVATIGAFGGFALWGFFTQRSLAGIGHFAFMGLIGLVILGFVQIFWPSNAMNFLLGCGGVIVFTLLTAWDVQKIREMAQEGGNEPTLAVWGALSLYLDFINLFLSLLRLMGQRK